MATRLRKVRHLRGSRTHGWGQVGQHRHSGSRGGTGMAGMHKHKWSYTVKYATDHFGHNKFAPPKRKLIRRWLNVGDLESLLNNGMKGEEVDLGAMGYDKLLGQGSISTAFSLRVPRASSSAVEKVQAAGGSIEVKEVSESRNTRESGSKEQKEGKS
jgi:large subunit ribosomal protein L15